MIFVVKLFLSFAVVESFILAPGVNCDVISISRDLHLEVSLQYFLKVRV